MWAAVAAAKMAFTYGWYDPPLAMSATDQEKTYAPMMSAASREISSGTLYHEIIQVHFTGEIRAGTQVDVSWQLTDPFQEVFSISKRATEGGWSWYRAWIGHLPDKEIYRAGKYRCVISFDGVKAGEIEFTITEGLGPGELYLSGTVTDAVTGAVIRGANVNFVLASMKTDAMGKYKLLGYQNSGGTLTVDAVGYARYQEFLRLGSGISAIRDVALAALPPQPPQGTATVEGRVSDSDLNVGISGVTVSVGGKSMKTTLLGDYGFQFTEGYSGLLTAEKEGYQKFQEAITITPGVNIRKDVRLVKLPPAEYPYKKLPVPAEISLPAKFVPYYEDLDQKLDAGDIAGVLNILRLHGLEEGSMIFLGIVISWKVIAGAITAVVGSKAFSAFLLEESLQTVDMSIYTAESNKQWDLVAQMIAKKEQLLEVTIWENIISWIPGINTIAAVNTFVDASRAKMMVDKELLARKTSNVMQPSPMQFSTYVELLDAGQDPYPAAPKARSIIIINVNAPSGEIKIDDVGYSSLFPFTIETTPGDHTVQILSEGFKPYAKVIRVEPYESRLENIYLTKDIVIEPEPEKGTMDISSAPAQAKIYIDDVYIWEKTNTTIRIAPGHHKLTLKLDGYQDYSVEFDILAEETKTYQIALAPIDEIPPEIPGTPGEEVTIPLVPGMEKWNAWKVTIRAIDALTLAPISAAILVNDVYMDKNTPYYFYFAPESTYNIKLRKSGYKQGETQFTTKPLPEQI